MVFNPRLEDYDINILVALGNQTDDVFTRNHIKFLIVEKICLLNYSMFYLINKFIGSKKILKEVYAEVIVILMKNSEYYIDDIVMNQIIKLASLDTLAYYGMESCSLRFSLCCKEEFWNRAKDLEDKVELNNKKSLGKIKKRKVIKNDKY